MTFTELLALVSWGSGVRVCSDSRKVGEGEVFVAISGVAADGHDFIGEAAAKGAGYIVCENRRACGDAEEIIVVDSSEALGLLAQGSFGNPSAKLVNLAVTGTNGKTTVSYLVRSVIMGAGKECGLVGTIGYETGLKSRQANMTTPDALAIAKMAGEMVEAGHEYMVIEASSHALSQRRLAGINFAAAAFTNLTGDHLDYHGSADKYLAAKMRLFTGLPCHAIAVLNGESEASEDIAKCTKVRKLWYAIEKDADIRGHIESMDIDGTVCRIEFGWQKATVRTSLTGRHNVSNILAAAGLCLAAGFDLDTIAKGLSAMECVPGRLEKVECGQDFAVLVDYAHTDDALKNVLGTLRPLCKGALAVVFGCGGDRDKTKRPRMAKVAEKQADRVIITSDNPRTEDADRIIADIMAGFAEPERVTAQTDRKMAIEAAIKGAGAGDIILIAGKGHEDYQVIGTERVHFDDVEVAAEILKGTR